jgi:hypothetical protein
MTRKTRRTSTPRKPRATRARKAKKPDVVSLDENTKAAIAEGQRGLDVLSNKTLGMLRQLHQHLHSIESKKKALDEIIREVVETQGGDLTDPKGTWNVDLKGMCVRHVLNK